MGTRVHDDTILIAEVKGGGRACNCQNMIQTVSHVRVLKIEHTFPQDCYTIYNFTTQCYPNSQQDMTTLSLLTSYGYT